LTKYPIFQTSGGKKGGEGRFRNDVEEGNSEGKLMKGPLQKKAIEKKSVHQIQKSGGKDHRNVIRTCTKKRKEIIVRLGQERKRAQKKEREKKRKRSEPKNLEGTLKRNGKWRKKRTVREIQNRKICWGIGGGIIVRGFFSKKEEIKMGNIDND